ncbi:hypothetical protein K437DRAFT_257463 [Tilletiaria anomala UBC 951]|uniref:Cytoplasmic tRNA 2-thiolation protein 2 n=1 Tax=Tilletiaria anomala (strain ATCC 24038 / CBS 436.72 / UBC 951) TaxID=1037660 RepID=A0A066VTG1_TILAU|nr:uncharacterized protein K437DRAFT_257463 [Tilletiaria anomala UBC 951]KDN43563.1 hypothetical protein K437DRAFT_257463 [Tilletiaria anomala UBC 951]
MPCPDPDDEQAQAACREPGRAPSSAVSPSPQERHAARSAKQRATASNPFACSRCQSPRYAATAALRGENAEKAAPVEDEGDDRPVLKLREERFCTTCALRLIRNRASRSVGGYTHARGACIMRKQFEQQACGQVSSPSRVLIALSGGPNSRALLHLTADIFGVDMYISGKRRQQIQQKGSRGIVADVAVQSTNRLTHRAVDANLDGNDTESVGSGSAFFTSSAVPDISTEKRSPDAGRRGRARGTQRPADIDVLDALHVDDSALFFSSSEEVDYARKSRRDTLQRMIDNQNALLCSTQADYGNRYRLVTLNLEDIFCSDEQLAQKVFGTFGLQDEESRAWFCTVKHDPNTSLFAPSYISSTDVSNRHLLLDLFSRIAAKSPLSSQCTASANASATSRTALTRIEDLHRILMDTLIRRVAVLPHQASLPRAQAYQALLLGTSATRSAVRLMDALSKGEGAKLAVNNAAAQWFGLPTAGDRRVLVLRPLADCSAKELGWLVHNQHLEYIQPRDLAGSALFASEHVPRAPTADVNPGLMGSKASLERLTEAFVLSLETNVSSTVSTIGKIGSKLVLSSDNASPAEDEAGQQPVFEVHDPSVKQKNRSNTESSFSTGPDFLDKSLYTRLLSASQAKMVHDICDFSCFPLSRTKEGAQSPICPLCCMPAQREDARSWRSKISIRSSDAISSHTHPKAVEPAVAQEAGELDLTARLCYACTLVLDTPPVDGHDKDLTLPLPAHALHMWALTSVGYDHSFVDVQRIGLDGNASEYSALQLNSSGFSPSTQRRGDQQVVRRVERTEMRQHLDKFLLDGGE